MKGEFMKSKRMLRNQKGFTLIEIIAVLVILGILAAVAIPRFVDLQDDAKLKAIDGALASGGSNAYMVYSRAVLAGDSTPTAASLSAALSVADYQRVGDFTVSYAAGTAPSGCSQAVAVTYTGGPTANYYTGTAPSKTFCIY